MDTRGFDAWKRINGRKRHIVVYTIGLMLVLMVTAVSIQDRDGGQNILERLHGTLGSVCHIVADSADRGTLLDLTRRAWGVVVEVAKKPADQLGFAVLPRRRVVERTFSWLMRWRRLVCVYERLPETQGAMVHIAMIGLMLNRRRPTTRNQTLDQVTPKITFKTPLTD